MDAILSSQDSNGDAEAAGMGNGGEEAGSSSTISAGGGISTTLGMEVDIGMGNSKVGESLLVNPEHTIIFILQMILLIFLCVFGTVANSLVFWVFNRRPALRSLSNRFVLSLVTANILISSIIAPLLLFETILYEYLLLPCISDVISTISSCVIFSAVFSTFLIATDRFYAVTSPLHYSMTITRSRSQVMIIMAWLSGLVLALPYILLCTISHHALLQKNLHIIFVIMQTGIGYLFPFVGLCWLYLRMYHAAHRNSERTRKHSISGELLTVMDGSTSVIPQGIDFLTHYMNPFTRAPMAGSVQPSGNGHHQNERSSIGVVPVVVKKSRRRSSNGSSSSLLFREEGRAIKTAFFVLASFFVCWTPHFAFMLVNEISSGGGSLGHYYVYDNVTLVQIDSALPKLVARRDSSTFEGETPRSFSSPTYGSEWAKFLGVFGMLLSSVLNPFIYVFRNKMACEEILRLVYGLVGKKHLSKEDQLNQQHNHHYHHHHQQQREKETRKSTDSTGSGVANPVMNDTSHHHLYDNDGLPVDAVDYQPRYTPCIGKSPKRSSMKSLTPQSSINSTMTNCNSMNGAPADSASPTVTRANIDESSHNNISFCNGRPPKPPFMRSLTLPEQTQPRVKFPPNLTRQKSYACKAPKTNNNAQAPTVSTSLSGKDVSSAAFKRAKFVRQDSICSILSNDSVLMICSEDGMSVAEVGPLGILNLSIPSHHPGGNARSNNIISRVPERDNEEETSPQKHYNTSSSINGTPVSKCYLRQDSNFSDASHRTNDSGIVLSSICSFSKQSESCGTAHAFSPESCHHHAKQVSPTNQVRNGHCGRHSTHPNSCHQHNHSKKQSGMVSTTLPNSNHHHQESNYHQETHHSPMLLQTSI